MFYQKSFRPTCYCQVQNTKARFLSHVKIQILLANSLKAANVHINVHKHCEKNEQFNENAQHMCG